MFSCFPDQNTLVMDPVPFPRRRAIVKEANPALTNKFKMASDKERFLGHEYVTTCHCTSTFCSMK